MFSSLTALMSSAAKPATAVAPLDIVDAVNDLVQAQADMDDVQAHRTDIANAQALIAIAGERGIDRALMSFINADGNLTALGATQVAALESLSDGMVTADGAALRDNLSAIVDQDAVAAQEGLKDYLAKRSNLKDARHRVREASKRADCVDGAPFSRVKFDKKDVAKRVADFRKQSKDHGGALRHGGKLAAAAIVGGLATAGALYLIKRRAKLNVPGTKTETETFIEFGKRYIAAAERMMSIGVPEAGADTGEFYGELNHIDFVSVNSSKVVVSRDESPFRRHSTRFTESGWTADNLKHAASESEHVRAALTKAQERQKELVEKIGSGSHDAAAAHSFVSALDNLLDYADSSLGMAEYIIAGVAHHVSADKEEADQGGEETE